MQKQDIKLIIRIDGHDRDVNILESNLTATKNNLTKISDDVIDHDEANKKNLEALDDKIDSEAENITETFEVEIAHVKDDFKTQADELRKQLKTMTIEMSILRANFSEAMNRIERLEAQSVISKGGPSIESGYSNYCRIQLMKDASYIYGKLSCDSQCDEGF